MRDERTALLLLSTNQKTKKRKKYEMRSDITQPTMFHLNEENRARRSTIWSRLAREEKNEENLRIEAAKTLQDNYVVLRSTHKCHIICTTILGFSSHVCKHTKCVQHTIGKLEIKPLLLASLCLFCFHLAVLCALFLISLAIKEV